MPAKHSNGEPGIGHQPGGRQGIDQTDEVANPEIDVARRDHEQLADRGERQGERRREHQRQPEGRQDPRVLRHAQREDERKRHQRDHCRDRAPRAAGRARRQLRMARAAAFVELAKRCLDQPLLRSLAAAELGHHRAVPHHQRAVAFGKFGIVGRVPEHRPPLVRQAAKQPVEVGLGADVDAARRIVQHDDVGFRRQAPARSPPSADCRR